MRVHDLGTLTVEVDGVEKTFGRSKQGALLAVLVLAAGRRVGLDELVDAVWGENEVPRATVDSAVWRLRQALQSRGDDPVSIEYESGGYRLVVDPVDVDSVVFETLTRSAREAVQEKVPRRALDEADRALRLWRGRPHEALSDTPAAAPVVARLEELHTQLHETRIDALILLGHLEQALADLEPLIARMPFQEHLWAQRMTALAACGRTEEALSTYTRVRTLLAGETGLDPGPELRQLHQRILSHEVQPPATAAAAPEADRQVHLPRRATRLVGRDEDCARLTTLITRHTTVTVTGTGGTGKTRLAVEAARQAAGSFPHGVWFVDLTAVTDPAQVVEVTASTLGLGAVPTVDTSAALVEFVRGRRMAIVLDNCEHVLDAAAQLVETLGAASSGLTLVTTSREPLGADGEIIWSLSPLRLRSDKTGPTSSAAELFIERAAAAAPQLDLSEDLDQVEEICQALDGLPLAIELAAARVRTFSVGEIARQVTASPTRLARLGRSTAAHHASVDATIDWSYRLLGSGEQVLHRNLSTLAGPFTVPAAQAVVDGAGPDVAQLLAGLTHRSLLDAQPGSGAGATSRFSQLATVRAHAAERLDAEADAADVFARRDRWVRELLSRRPRLGHPDEAAWFDDLEDAYPTIRLTLTDALDHGHDPDWLVLGSGLVHFWYHRYRVIEGGRWLQAATDVWADRVARVEAAKARLRLGDLQMVRTQPVLARSCIDAGLPVVLDPADEDLIDVVELLVSVATGVWALNDLARLGELSGLITRLAGRSDDAHLLLHADAVACVARLGTTSPARVADEAGEVYQRGKLLGNRWVMWLASLVAAIVAQIRQAPVEGQRWSVRMLRHHLELGEGGTALEVLANLSAQADDLALAARIYGTARVAADRAGLAWPVWPGTTGLVDDVRRRLGTTQFDEQWRVGEQQSLQELMTQLALFDPAG